MARIDAPSWTFGLNSKVPGPTVPGPGTYDIAGRLLSKNVGTQFGRRSVCDRREASRLVFDGEVEDRRKPGPGTYNLHGRELLSERLKGSVLGTKCHTPRLSESTPATDAGPGAYVPFNFTGRGPSHTIAARPPEALEATETPGPGQYIEVQVGVEVGRKDDSAVENFGNRSSPRFAEERETTPGPGAYQPSIPSGLRGGGGKTFGRRFRSAGWSARIKEMDPFPWETGSDQNVGRARASVCTPLRRYDNSTDLWVCSRLQRQCPSSVPLSSRLRRACARGRKLPDPDRCTGAGENKRSRGSILENNMVRRREPPTWTAGNYRVLIMGSPGAGTLQTFGTALQRPSDPPSSPGPSSYSPPTLDEAARNNKVFGIGGMGQRALFPPSPQTPGPAYYAREIIQGKTLRALSCRYQTTTADCTASTTDTVLSESLTASQSSMPAGTFGTSERFPRDTKTRPGVGEYGLTVAEKVKPPIFSMGRRPKGAPYDPSLNRYLRLDSISTPSPHSYRLECEKGGGGMCSVSGVHAPTPRAWSFGAKRPTPRPPDGPGPGRYRPPYDSTTPGVRFGVGREETRGCVSQVPWVEVEERADRGEGGGREAKLYLPRRTRVGARVFMASRRVPNPSKRRRSRSWTKTA